MRPTINPLVPWVAATRGGAGAASATEMILTGRAKFPGRARPAGVVRTPSHGVAPRSPGTHF